MIYPYNWKFGVFIGEGRSKEIDWWRGWIMLLNEILAQEIAVWTILKSFIEQSTEK